MAAAEEIIDMSQPQEEKPKGFWQTPTGRNFFLAIMAATALSVITGVYLWSQQPEYKVLYSNFNDRDGGAIVAALQQMNIPYKYSEGGVAILVPAANVHDVRLKLASQGLPKGGNVGFELMENQKLGISQFLEQVNFQRALEGELARSIQSVGAVQSARVHLALPKPSVFVREQQKPTASVLLNLHPGRSLDQAQVNAIVHLVASSVPDLVLSNVTVVDQNGILLSETGKGPGAKALDPNQLKYVQQLQANIVKQVESIVAPIVGANNVRAEATADVDFSQIEQANETYRPNQPPDKAAVRSLQSSESTSPAGSTASGVPGALSNQPPTPATASINTPANANANTSANVAGNSRKDVTTNFEVDKTVRYSQQAMGGLKRLSVAVVVNYRRIVDPKTGKVTIKPLTADEIAQINKLVREAMGFSQERNDTLNVVNTPFDGVDKPEVIPEPLPWWKDPVNINMALTALKYLVLAAIAFYFFVRILLPLWRPVMRKFDELTKLPAPPPPEPEPEPEPEVTEEEIQAKTALEEMEAKLHQGYRENLQMAKNMAKEDPRIVANVIKSWVGA
ncbi:MAG: flagellar M-ring protein FliF [Burkholderiales bacterium]|nr:flagellar M-ring protein FliF [Burkholderiales bacterium]